MTFIKKICGITLILNLCFVLSGCETTKRYVKKAADKVVEADQWIQENLW